MSAAHGRAAARTVVIALVVALLAGCARPAPDLTDAAAAVLQADVLAVSQASAAGDLPAARAALDVLTEHVGSARDDGTVSAARRDVIEASIVLVSADLSALEHRAAQVQAAARQAAADKAAADDADADADAERNSGHGKDKSDDEKSGKDG